MAIFNEVPGFPEMVVDGITTRRIQVNHPEIMDAIYRVRVGQPAQYAKGKYPTNQNDTSNLRFNLLRPGVAMDIEQNKVLKELANAVNQLLKWKPKVYTEMIKKDLDNLSDIERNRGL